MPKDEIMQKLEDIIIWIALNTDADINYVLLASQGGTREHPMPVRPKPAAKASKFMEEAHAKLSELMIRERIDELKNISNKALFVLNSRQYYQYFEDRIKQLQNKEMEE